VVRGFRLVEDSRSQRGIGGFGTRPLKRRKSGASAHAISVAREMASRVAGGAHARHMQYGLADRRTTARKLLEKRGRTIRCELLAILLATGTSVIPPHLARDVLRAFVRAKFIAPIVGAFAPNPAWLPLRRLQAAIEISRSNHRVLRAGLRWEIAGTRDFYPEAARPRT